MQEKMMKMDYRKAFRLIAIFAAVLLLLSAAVIPLSLSRQIGDLVSLEQSGQAIEQIAEHGEHHGGHEELWKSEITPLTAANYAVLGGTAVLWLALGSFYWLLTAAWLYKSAVNAGMNRSLWLIAGLLCNLLAILAFLIVRDDPRRTAKFDRKQEYL